METMFKDTRSSGEIVAAYKKHIKGAQKYQGLELNVRVLTPTSWPLSTWTGKGDAKDAPVSGVFSADLTAHLDSFKQFYLTKHNGRILSWQPQLVLFRYRGLDILLLITLYTGRRGCQMSSRQRP